MTARITFQEKKEKSLQIYNNFAKYGKNTDNRKRGEKRDRENKMREHRAMIRVSCCAEKTHLQVLVK